MWEIEVIMRDSEMSGVLRDIQAESGMVGNYDTCTYITLLTKNGKILAQNLVSFVCHIRTLLSLCNTVH